MEIEYKDNPTNCRFIVQSNYNKVIRFWKFNYGLPRCGKFDVSVWYIKPAITTLAERLKQRGLIN